MVAQGDTPRFSTLGCPFASRRELLSPTLTPTRLGRRLDPFSRELPGDQGDTVSGQIAKAGVPESVGATHAGRSSPCHISTISAADRNRASRASARPSPSPASRQASRSSSGAKEHFRAW